MRLEEHLKDIDERVDIMLDILKSNCDKFLKEIKGGKLLGQREFSKAGWILRGTSGLGEVEKNGLVRKKSYIEHRIPRVASHFIHDLANIAGKKIFGWPIRNGIATKGMGGSVVDEIRVFGKMRIFLPIGNYEYVWSPNIRDFNNYGINDIYIHNKYILKGSMKDAISYLNNSYKQSNPEDDLKTQYNFTYKEVYNEALRAMEEYVKHNYKNNQLRGAIKIGHEVSFKCNEYFLVTDNYIFQKAIEKGNW